MESRGAYQYSRRHSSKNSSGEFRKWHRTQGWWDAIWSDGEVVIVNQSIANGSIVSWKGCEGRFRVQRTVFDFRGEGHCLLLPLDAPDARVEAPLCELSLVISNDGEGDVLTDVILGCLEASPSGLSSEVFRCRALFKPYQFRPLLKLIKSDGRLLIADETGLGKTIEASYIILDEILRNNAKRILIVCPSHLNNKWRSELWNRFGLSFAVVSGPRAAKDIAERDRRFRYIVSIDSIKVHLTGLGLATMPDLDLLVIDEVHNAIGRGEDTKRRVACMELSGRSKKVVGISASPVHLEEDDLFRVIEAIDPGRLSHADFEREMEKTARLNWLVTKLGREKIPRTDVDTISNEIIGIANSDGPIIWTNQEAVPREALTELVKRERWPTDPVERQALRIALGQSSFLAPFMTRTKRSEVGEERRRLVRNIEVTLNHDSKSSLLSAVGTTEADVFHEIDQLFSESFSHLHRRQLASSMPAMIDLLYNGMEGLNYWSGNGAVAVGGRTDEASMEKCKVLSRRLRSLRVDSKWDAFHVALEDLKGSAAAKKVIVFTQWLPTFRYLQGRLNEAGYVLFAASGETDGETRSSIMRSFQEHNDFCVLLATDILSEGVDLQTANCIVNYDLPYNPQRIEQRIGRVDRVGQKEDTIHIVNLRTKGSVDDDVYETLLTRTWIINSAVGELPIAITEGMDEKGGIESMDVVRQVNDYLDRRGIGDLESLQGAEKALDRDIELVFENSVDRDPFWLTHLITYYLSNVLDTGRVTIRAEGGKRVLIGGLDHGDLEILSEAAPMDERYYLGQAMDSAMEGNTLALDLVGRGGKGLFTPLAHPLTSGLIKKLCVDRLSEEQPRTSIPILHLPTYPSPSLHGGRYALATFDYTGKMLNRKELNIVRLDGGSNEVHEIGMNDLFGGTDTSEMPRFIRTIGSEECAELDAVVEAAYARWESEMRKEDESLIRKWQSRAIAGKVPINLDRPTPSEVLAQRSIPGHVIIAIIENRVGGFE